MSEIIETVKDTFAGKSKKLNLIWILGAVGVVGVALYLRNRNRNSDTPVSGGGDSSIPVSNAPSSSAGDVVTREEVNQYFTKFSDSVGGEIDRLDASLKSLDTATATVLTNQNKQISDLQAVDSKTMSTFSEFVSKMNSFNPVREENPIVTSPAVNQTAVTQNTAIGANTLAQFEFGTQLAQVQRDWNSLNQQALSDKNISATERAQLDALHAKASAISSQAGWGAGNVDGSGRNIPEEVKTATGAR